MIASLLLSLALLAAPSTHEVKLTQLGPSKIQVIKHVRAATGLGLKETKDLVERAPVVVFTTTEQEKAESLARELAAAGARAEVLVVAGPIPRQVEKADPGPAAGSASGLSVRLTATGPSKIRVIKELRAATGLELKDAKDLAERAPCIVRAGLSRQAAELLVLRLREAGASAEVEEPR